MSVLFVAAVREELGSLDGVALGVGVVPAGIAAASLLERLRQTRRGPDAVVLVGTAGAYGDMPIGAVVAARRIGLVSGTAAMGRGYVPLAPGPIETDAGLRAELGLPEADVATLVAITTDPALATRIGADWAVEHMEAYGVAAACAAADVPFAAVLGITNRVGPDAHAEWRANRDRCQRAAVAAVARLAGGR